MPPSPAKAAVSLRTHLVVFAVAILLPVSILAAVLLVRGAALERRQTEDRLVVTAEGVAAEIDRALSNLITLVTTLGSSPFLQSGDLAAFHVQATAAVREIGGNIFVVDPLSLQQLVNTLVPWGEPLPRTGDPETVRRVYETRRPQVSNHFVGLVSRAPAFNVDVPVFVGDELRYVLLLGVPPDVLIPILKVRSPDARLVTSVVDRNGIVLARTLNHEVHSGTLNPRFADERDVAQTTLYRTESLEGVRILRAVTRSAVSGWLVASNVPAAVAEAPLRRSLITWGASTAAAALVSLGLALLFARSMAPAMQLAAAAAEALGRRAPIPPLRSRLREANAVVQALADANQALRAREEEQRQWEEHQRLLLAELSHRVKNSLAVVQALARRTFTEARSTHEARRIFLSRLQVMARAHEALVETNWQGASLRGIVAAELTPFAERARIDGPDVLIKATLAQTLALVMHELTTNAIRYGALADASGHVDVHWHIEGTGPEARLRFRWQEGGGPPVTQPDRKGFGNILLERAVANELGAAPRLTFPPTGLLYEIDVRLADVTTEHPVLDGEPAPAPVPEWRAARAGGGED